MKYRYLGKSGLYVSRFCLGTMNFSEQLSRKESFRIMDKAVECGLNFWDTANCYGIEDGENEEFIGQWFKANPGYRERIIISTKVYVNMPGDWELQVEGKSRGHLNGYRIKKHLEGSLRRLQTDYIDLYHLHHYDRDADWRDIWGSLEAAFLQGKICYCGSSNFAARDILEAQQFADKRNFLGLVSEQHLYNLFTRQAELEVLPTAAAQGMGVMLFSPLSGGLLAGNALKNKGNRSSLAAQRLSPGERNQLERFSKLCGELGEPEVHVALAWTLSNPAVTCPIVGPRSAEQLEQMVRAAELELPQDFLDKLNEIFPGPGPAPTAYTGW